MRIPIRTIDLFCGAGGSSFGAAKAGADIVAGFDLWEPAIQIYKENFPQAKVFHTDLRDLSSRDIGKIGTAIGNVDLILASPECTNHSRAKGAAERSEASKETAFEVIRFAKVFKPKWIIIENVIEMESWDRYKDLFNSLWELKYFVRKVILNAKDFGVPQSRERLFLLCSLSGETKDIIINPQQRQSVSSIIDNSGKYEFSYLRKKGRAVNTLKSADRAIAELGENTPFLLVYYGSARKGNKGWQPVDAPLGTITTLDRFAYVIPSQNGHMMRMLQPEELKLAMGFDKSFNLDLHELTRRQKIKLMGNGVCPPVMEHIIRSLVN